MIVYINSLYIKLMDTKPCIIIKTNSFLSLASSHDLQTAFSKPEFVAKIAQLSNKVQSLHVVECAKKFVSILRETLMLLTLKLLKSKDSFPCNN